MAVARLQHRQQPAGRGDRSRAIDRGGRRQAGDPGIASNAAGRRPGDLCGRGRPRGRGRIPTQDADRGGGPPVRRLVP